MDPVDDVGIVAELRADRTQGFSLLYEAYAERLFAYAITVTRDRELAADVAHNAIIRAVDGIGKLRDPELLRPWLFRITRNEAISALRKGNRWSDDESAIEDLASEPDFDQNLKAQDAQQLVSAAMQGLSPVDRDVLALALRKDLSTQDVAAAMGTSTNQASARLSRAKTALTNAVTAVVLCRQRRSDCTGLAEAMSDYSGTLNPLTRKRITKHVRDCTTCATQGRRRARQYVAGFTLPIAIATAAGFRAQAQAALTGEIGALGATDEAGFPVPQDAPGAEELFPLISSDGISENITAGEPGSLAQTADDSQQYDQLDGDPSDATEPGGDADPDDFTLDTMFLDPNEQPTEVIEEPAQGPSRAGWLLAGAGVLVLLLLVGMGIAIQKSADEAPAAAVPDAAVEQARGQATASGTSASPSQKKQPKKDRTGTNDETRSPTPSASPGATSSSRASSSPSSYKPSATASATATPSSTRSTSTPSASTKPPSTKPTYSSSPSQVSKPTSEPTTSRPTAKPTTAEPKPTTADPNPTSDYRTPSYSSAPTPTQSSAPTYKDPVPSYSAKPASTPKSTATSGGTSAGSGN